MNQFVPVTEFFLYILFSFLVGHVALQFVPESNKPNIVVRKPVLLLATLGIIVFSFGPVLQVILYFSESVGLGLTAFSVLTKFQVGIAWIFTGFIATFLWMTIYVEGSKYIQAFWLILMILAVGYASHVASLSFWSGFVTHSLHFTVITLWVGILIQVSWFSKEAKNWAAFLKWFTPFSIGLLIVTIVTGLILMFFVVTPKDYTNSWVLPYGQMLLLKHISIIPVLLFAFINGVLAKKSYSNPLWDPKPWIRTESISLFLVFFFTGVLGTLSPAAHDVATTFKTEGAAPLVEFITGSVIKAPIQTELVPTLEGMTLIVLSGLFLLMIVISFYKQVKPIVAFGFGICFLITMYLGIMLNLSV
ncbi:hypothetical protein M4D55_19615 [Metabacillus idriensis]|uniref:copper resistance D family protein n=1 Tax=Metabacillus idriensis TaxID=324768 RepID=UPI0008A9BBDC|nr:CopD family protein [Metabacillus idriensis]MCM3597976.1 hypothetical protein [Metabacillus idriensis]OHR73656.1 hypothetical protein HMPREF3291_18545 [Bacillus sp. HMSC76G11]